MSARRLAELSGPAFAGAIGPDSIVVLPTGAVEHHGAHLPLATDLLMAAELAERVVDAAAATGIDAWVLPPLGFTKSDEHAWAPGTVWMSADTLLAVLRDIGASLAAGGVRTLVLYNGHGGNTALLNVALRELRRLSGLRTFLVGVAVPSGDGVEGPDELGFGIHGGWGETSLLMHLRPELVDPTAFVRAVPDRLAGFQRVGFAGKPVQFGWLSSDFEGGVIGDPTGSSAEAGERIATRIVAEGVAALEEVSRWPSTP